jgi:hypothetical protein
VERIVTLTLETTPREATYWSTRAMARQCGLSQSTVSWIWRAFSLQPHRSETFKLSPDPLFIEKVQDIVGLYLNPPDQALVLYVDEKVQIQALDCSQPLLPMGPGRAAHPRLRASRHDVALRRTRYSKRLGDQRTLSPTPRDRVPEVPGHEARRRASRPSQNSDRRDALEICDGVRPGFYRAMVHIPTPGINTLRTALSRRCQPMPRSRRFVTLTSAVWMRMKRPMLRRLTSEQLSSRG